jgi:hypothetical protein
MIVPRVEEHFRLIGVCDKRPSGIYVAILYEERIALLGMDLHWYALWPG